MEALFWTSALIIAYTFIGYGLIISALAFFKRKSPLTEMVEEDWPEITLLVAAYNEAAIIAQKVENCLELDYPSDKLNLLFITDGSDDGTPELIKNHPQVKVMHLPQRKGKIAAVNRAMPHVKTPIVIFTDANVMINKTGIKEMMRHFQSNLVGAVSGEKRVLSAAKDGASASGEGLYWKYESYLKRKDAEWNSLVGSAGELFAIRRHLYKPVAEDVLIEDFVMTMGIAAAGYRVAYESKAMATETASANMEEESKRKVRIAAGGIQAMIRLTGVLGVFSHPKLFFQYFSHRVLRWTLMPVALVCALLAAGMLYSTSSFYTFALWSQIAFYILAFFGHVLRNRKIRIKGFFTPYYFTYMHICVVRGWFRYFQGRQKVTWQKAERAVMNEALT